ncbi:transport and Golgi organization protein 2 homolog [Saccoglossus kowalevskii]|uniref:Transport and Golgi organization protein 2 homolog n=1 Tax=Saccoglossus kowalevskii TaxID=10224 RepID=A0ABM0MM49_SACKO|nr:PREDICTED: transport and Golgi organization protein 2 homolog [Saccoglossus kowalevskii]
MCILFFKLDVNPPTDGYKLILASNRDEYLDKPTKPASWWQDHPHILSGLDMRKGRVGGTWLGISKEGRLASLLNILQPQLDRNAKGRGPLVRNFIKSDVDCLPYLQEIAKEGQLYNGFNLLVMDLPRSNSIPQIGYYSNMSGKDPELLTPGIHSLCNAIIDKPWKKAIVGKRKFEEIVNSATKRTEEKLVDQLIEFLNDDTPHPEPQINIQCNGELTLKQQQERSAVCVKSPDLRCGSRTNTIILVNAANKVKYVERTLQEPIDIENLKWLRNNYDFNLSSASSSY